MKMVNKYLVLIILILAVGCHSKEESGAYDIATNELAAPTNEQSQIEVTDRKLIKNGSVEFETEHIDSTRKTIFKVVELHKGYISSDQEYKSPGRTSNTIVIRVPAAHFDRLLTEATQGVDNFDSKEININDVTEEYLDIEARLKTKKELEKRYLELLKRANTVTEILAIEKQIGELRSEIESVEGRLNFLQNQVTLSTLTITFYERTSAENEFGRKFSDGFKNGWDNLIWLFVILTNIWPFIMIGIVLIIGIRIISRKK